MRTMRRLAVCVAAAVAVGWGLCVAAVPSDAQTSASGSAGRTVSLTYWLWGESNVPGMDKWMAEMVAAYAKSHPDLHIDVVSQSDDTLVGDFRLAAQGRSGPDIDTQWATLPTLTPLWNGWAVPISDYLPASETNNWINTEENVAGGKVVAMPLYLVGIPLVWNKTLFRRAGLDPDKGPATWEEFLSDCEALKQHGITPIGMGNKDGWFGAWLFSIYALQDLDSLDQIKSAIGDTGGYRLTQFEELLRRVYALMQDLVTKDYVNSDVASLDLNQGASLFPEQKAAFAFNTDSIVLSWARILGEDAIGVSTPPRWGHGRLADAYDVTQSSDAFITSWARDKAAAAAFMAWLHRPENLMSFYRIGAFPADKRFPIASVTDPLARRLLQLDAIPKEIWLENYLPPEVDNDADLPAGELIFSKSGTPDQAVAIWDRVVRQWRLQHESEFRQYRKWAAGDG